MKSYLVVIIIVLAGLFALQMRGGNEEKTVVDVAQQQKDSMVLAKQEGSQEQVQESMRRVPKEKTGPTIVLPEGQTAGTTLGEYNARHVQQSEFQAEWDVTAEQAATTNVSQAQLDIVRRRELAVQRRDYMLQRRAETIEELSSQDESKTGTN